MIEGRYVQVCLEHGMPLEPLGHETLGCPMGHTPAEWFVFDLEMRRAFGGICCMGDGDMGQPVGGAAVERARAAIARPVIETRPQVRAEKYNEEDLMKKGEKLTEEQRDDIVRNHVPEETHAVQAVKYGITQSTYSRILRESQGKPASAKKPGPKKAKAPKIAKAAPSVAVMVPGLDLRGVLVAHLEYLRKETAKVESVLEALED